MFDYDCGEDAIYNMVGLYNFKVRDVFMRQSVYIAVQCAQSFRSLTSALAAIRDSEGLDRLRSDGAQPRL